MDRSAYFDAQWETAPRDQLRERQLVRLRKMLGELLATNRFYREKLASAGLSDPRELATLDDLRRLPTTSKGELLDDQLAHPPFGTNLTYPLERYVKIHQTSGTSGGRPLRVLDTAESWAWWLRCWQHVYVAAGIGGGDRVFCAFSFGPFIGFWTAYEAAPLVGAMAVPGGGQDSIQRLRSIEELGATVLLSTPTYALRLAEVAAENWIAASELPVRTTIHAGEPGASIPSTRERIDAAWGAECYDHIGASEVGATGFTCRERSGVHLLESEYVFEVIDPETGKEAPVGGQGELLVTNLGRIGMPVIRYRTGDLVTLDDGACGCGRNWARLAGGILGRSDDMVVVRGVNVFPSSIEDIVREFATVAEFRLELFEDRQMNELRLTIEPTGEVRSQDGPELARAVSDAIHRRLFLRVPCDVVDHGSLPRFELKAERFFRHGLDRSS
jgi:phenylacetate-CoA ligase